MRDGVIGVAGSTTVARGAGGKGGTAVCRAGRGNAAPAGCGQGGTGGVAGTTGAAGGASVDPADAISNDMVTYSSYLMAIIMVQNIKYVLSKPNLSELYNIIQTLDKRINGWPE